MHCGKDRINLYQVSAKAVLRSIIQNQLISSLARYSMFTVFPGGTLTLKAFCSSLYLNPFFFVTNLAFSPAMLKCPASPLRRPSPPASAPSVNEVDAMRH